MEPIKKGKVRDIYDVGSDLLVIVTSDRISAFDVVLPTLIPGKGIILNQLSEYWCALTKPIIPNHLISKKCKNMPSDFHSDEFRGRSMLVRKLKMIPIECIVRGYITGSGWDSYQKTGKVCGIELQDGLLESGKLPEAIYTPTTKADEGHDEHITFDDTVSMVGRELAEKLRDKSLELYNSAAKYALKSGIIIADTKFEFGLDRDGNLVLADEILTPDSSRFWDANTYEIGKSQKSFDKQYVRDWLNSSGWDKKSPAPELPDDVVKKTMDKYDRAFQLLTYGTVIRNEIGNIVHVAE